MSPDPTNDARAVAIEQLKAFGLSSYAAETFVTLVSLGKGTAKDVSQASTVPRTRVYDAVDELETEGLVDVRYSSPREFRPISVETTRRAFVDEIRQRLDLMTTALEELQPVSIGAVQQGVWTVEGRKPVTEQVLELIDSADEEIIYATTEDLLTDEIIDSLRAASEGDVSLHPSGATASVRSQLEDRLGDAIEGETVGNWSGSVGGRLLLVDSEKILVSVLCPDEESDSALPTETAIWGTGPSNNLVMVLKDLFGDQVSFSE